MTRSFVLTALVVFCLVLIVGAGTCCIAAGRGGGHNAVEIHHNTRLNWPGALVPSSS